MLNHSSPRVQALAFPKAKRLLTPEAFAHVFDNVDCKQGGTHFTFLSRTNKLDSSRLGIIVAKRHCRRAIDRNRIKRYTRESFRHASARFDKPGANCDIVVIAKASAAKLANQQLNSELDRQWTKLFNKRRAHA